MPFPHSTSLDDLIPSPNHGGFMRLASTSLFLLAALCCVGLSPLSADEPAKTDAAKKEEWLPLFNGKDLTGWKPKIRYHELGDNFANTFRVEDGLLKVRYDGYEKFDETFGHLFYDKEFSHYILRVEYR